MNRWTTFPALLALSAVPLPLFAEDGQLPPTKLAATSSRSAVAKSTDRAPGKVLPAEEWRRIDSAVDRGLAFLAGQQQPDGSFPSYANAQPGVTSLCVLAFMAHGHTPGNGPYGKRLERAIKYIINCQKP